jgi:hypothetical protein
MAVNKDAALLIPKTYGPANGLRKIICNTNPQSANIPPDATAVKVLGTLISKRIVLTLYAFSNNEILPTNTSIAEKRSNRNNIK